MNRILKAEHISRTLPGEIPVTLVEGASVDIHAGEFVAITGPSGSGKSSLLYLLGLLDKPDSGQLWLAGTNISDADEETLAQIRLAQMGFVFQFHFLLPEFTALENIMLPMQRLGKLSESAMRARGLELLASLELSEHAHKIPRKLSGGQAQRVAIARALANDPILILADEPTGNLDSLSSANVQEILRDIAHQQNHAVVVVTHDQDFARTADRIIHIVDGRIVSS